MIIIKNSKNLGELLIKEIDRNTAKNIIVKNHYSHKWNTAFGKINIGIFKNDILLGCASFGNLMNPKSYKNINKDFESKNVIELNRLWIDDKLQKNAESILLGACWKILRNNYPHIKAVQSFADGRLGCGTIYKATNFKYYGYTKTLFYYNTISGDVQHKVPMENTMRPNGFIKLNRQWCEGVLKPFYVKTYRYIYPLYKNVKIDLIEQQYPQYDKGMEFIDNYHHNPMLIFRAYIEAYMFHQNDDANILYKYIINNFNESEIINYMKNGLNNNSINKLSKTRNCLDKLNQLKAQYIK